MRRTIDWNTYSPGRPMKAETIKAAEEFLAIVRSEPGIRSAEVSSRLEVPSKWGAQLSRSLEKRGLVKVVTGPGYLELYPPED